MGHYEHSYYIVLFSDVYTDEKDTQHKKRPGIICYCVISELKDWIFQSLLHKQLLH